MRADPNRHLAAITTLRGLLDVAADTHGLGVEERVVLVSAVLTSELVDARLAGIAPGRLDELLRAGEQVSVGMATTDAPEQNTPTTTEAGDQQPAPEHEQRVQKQHEQHPVATGPAAVVADAPRPADAKRDDDETGPDESAASDPLNFDSLFGDVGLAPAADPAGPLPGDALISAMGDDDEPPPPLVIVSPDQLLPPSPAADEELSTAHEGIRRHKRYPLRAEVTVRLLGHPDPIKLTTRDISVGGVFLLTDQTLPVSGRLVVELSITEGSLLLPGKIVHVAGQPVVGYGVEFDPLPAATTAKLEAFLSTTERPAQAEAAPDASGPLADVQRLSEGLDGGDLYAALALAPSARQADVQQRIRALREELTAAAGSAGERDAKRLSDGLHVLKRVENILSRLARRAAYDFTRGIVDVDRRTEEAARGDALELAALRQIWAQVHPARAEAAMKALTAGCALASRGEFRGASKEAAHALDDAPFSPELREHAARWAALAELSDHVEAGTSPEDGWLAWAAEQQADHAELREHWRRLKPEWVANASKLARRSLQAEVIKRFDIAAEASGRALGLDPFNDELRQAHDGWQAALDASAEPPAAKQA